MRKPSVPVKLTAEGWTSLSSGQDAAAPDPLEVAVCQGWLGKHGIPSDGLDVFRSSYAWKHVVERDSGCYVSNGALIAAALLSGYAVYPQGDSLNPLIGLEYLSPEDLAYIQGNLANGET